jgi:AcrR family transcriptional regulator
LSEERFSGPDEMSESYLATLSPSAQKLLRAARRLLVRKGFDALRWEAIAREARVQKSMIRYYFGDTVGLLRALLRLVIQDATMWLVEQSEQLPEGPARIHAHLQGMKQLIRNPQFLSFFDIVPKAFRDEKLRPPMAELYRWVRDINLRCFGVPVNETNVKELEAVASLFVAASAGIAIQAALDPEGYDPEPAFRELEKALTFLLEEKTGGSIHQAPPPGRSAAPKPR